MNKTLVFYSVKEFIHYRQLLDGTVGFVPTMGALHEGHASLLQKSAIENEKTILSIFINPTQFNKPEDLEKYPRTFENDLIWAEKSKVDAILYPNYQDIYPDNYRFKVTENEFSKILCGKTRPGHFDGVLTIVMKLLNIVQADHAYFGEKDFQQYSLIKDMVESYFIKTKIIGLPTKREESGLALSSRNLRLSNEAKIKASFIYSTICKNITAEQAQAELESYGFIVDYLQDYQQRRYVAAFLEGVRLIDNVIIK